MEQRRVPNSQLTKRGPVIEGTICAKDLNGREFHLTTDNMTLYYRKFHRVYPFVGGCAEVWDTTGERMFIDKTGNILTDEQRARLVRVALNGRKLSTKTI
jgi:hypothetical protein